MLNINIDWNCQGMKLLEKYLSRLIISSFIWVIHNSKSSLGKKVFTIYSVILWKDGRKGGDKDKQNFWISVTFHSEPTSEMFEGHPKFLTNSLTLDSTVWKLLSVVVLWKLPLTKNGLLSKPILIANVILQCFYVYAISYCEAGCYFRNKYYSKNSMWSSQRDESIPFKNPIIYKEVRED